jgi:hypothetical protein
MTCGEQRYCDEEAVSSRQYQQPEMLDEGFPQCSWREKHQSQFSFAIEREYSRRDGEEKHEELFAQIL